MRMRNPKAPKRNERCIALGGTPYRGLPAVTAWVKLKFTALNLKKLAIHKWMRLLVSSILHMIEATLLHGKVASLTV